MAANLKKLTLYPDKDFDIIRLCEIITQTDGVNFSELTTFAVEYYLRTGKCITIGYVRPVQYDKTLKMTPKNIYVKKNSLFDQWARENKGMPGFTLTNQVRDILHASIRLIEEGEEERTISLYDVMLEMRKAGTQSSVYTPEERRTDTITPQIHTQTAPETQIPEPVIKENNTKKEEAKPQKAQTSATTERDAAMSSAFLGGRKLSL